jgi:hypothetical protein
VFDRTLLPPLDDREKRLATGMAILHEVGA